MLTRRFFIDYRNVGVKETIKYKPNDRLIDVVKTYFDPYTAELKYNDRLLGFVDFLTNVDELKLNGKTLSLEGSEFKALIQQRNLSALAIHDAADNTWEFTVALANKEKLSDRGDLKPGQQLRIISRSTPSVSKVMRVKLTLDKKGVIPVVSFR